MGKWLLRLLGLLVVAVLACLVYLHTVGFPPFLKQMLVDQLARAGIAARFGLVQLDLFRGIVATDAVMADAKAPERVLAEIDQLELRWNWRRLIHRENPIQALRIANATISVPTPPDELGPSRFTARDAYATFVLRDDGSIEIDRLTGVYLGIRVFVTGRLKPRSAPPAPPAPPAPKKAAGEGRRPFGFITKVVRELNGLNTTVPPQIDLDFNIELDHPLDGPLTARLRGAGMQWRGLKLDSAAVDVEMRDGALTIKQCLAKLYGGELSVTGRYDVAMGQFDLQLTSTTDPTAFAAVLPRRGAAELRKLHVKTNPKLQVRFSLTPETGTLPRWQGKVEAGELTFRGVEFRAITFDFEVNGAEAQFSNAEVVTPEGRLLGHGAFDLASTDFTYEFDSTLDPTRLLPLMTPQTRRFIAPCAFDTPPHIIATVSGDFVDPDAFAYDAQISTERCSYRGVPLKRASAALRLRHSRLDVQDLILVRDEGQLRGTLWADFEAHRVSFDITTTANPTEMAPLLGEKAAAVMKPYRFGTNTDAQASGTVDFEHPQQSAWTAQVSDEGFGYWKLEAARARATITVTNDILKIDGFDGDFYGGKLRGVATFSLTNAPTYQFDFTTDRCDLQRLLSAIRGKESKASGSMTGHCSLQGQGSNLGALRGNGQIMITDGVLWEAPLFGIFSRILNDIGPGLGTTKATQASATFAIEDKTVKTDDLKVAAGAFTLTGHGKIGFDGRLDFRVNGQLLKAVPGINILTWFLSHVFEYKIGGTLGNPNYRPTNLPKELLPHGEMGEKPADKPPAN